MAAHSSLPSLSPQYTHVRPGPVVGKGAAATMYKAEQGCHGSANGACEGKIVWLGVPGKEISSDSEGSKMTEDAYTTKIGGWPVGLATCSPLI